MKGTLKYINMTFLFFFLSMLFIWFFDISNSIYIIIKDLFINVSGLKEVNELAFNINVEYWVLFNEVLTLIFIITCGLLLGLLFPPKVEVFQFINKCLVLLLVINFFYYNTFFVLNSFDKILNYSSLVHFLIIFGGVFIIAFLYIIAGSKKIIANNSNIEFSVLVFFSYLSIIFLMLANDFIVAILTLQCLSLVAYILVGFERYNRYSATVGIKYLLLGAIPGGLFIFGALDLYTIWGSFNEKDLELLYKNSGVFNEMMNLSFNDFLVDESKIVEFKNYNYNKSLFSVISSESYIENLNVFLTTFLDKDLLVSTSLSSFYYISIHFSYFYSLIDNFINFSLSNVIFEDFVYANKSILKNENIGIFFLLINLLFKITAAPFHSWAPKIYEGAPLISTIFLSIFSKIAIVFYLVHLLFNSFYLLLNETWGLIFYISIFASLFMALIGAYGEKRIKKFFVYSSMGHVSFIMLGLLTTSLHGVQASIEYLIIYTITSLIAWIVLLFLAPTNTHLTNLRGLSVANGSLSIALSISVLSMAGIPPLAGFFVKLNVLYSAMDISLKLFIAFILILTVFNFYYYLRVLKISFFEPVFENKYWNSINIMQARILWLNVLLISFFLFYSNSALTEIIEKLIFFW